MKMTYYARIDQFTGCVFDGEFRKGYGMFCDSVLFLDPRDLVWHTFKADSIIELNDYHGPAKFDITMNELLLLIHQYAATPLSDKQLETVVYINSCNISEYLKFSGRDLPPPPEKNSVFSSKEEALKMMGLPETYCPRTF